MTGYTLDFHGLRLEAIPDRACLKRFNRFIGLWLLILAR